MPRLLRYNLAPTLNGLIATLPSHSHAWIVPDASIDFAALYAEFDTFVMGRKTYETFLSLPAHENPLVGRAKEDVVVVTGGSQGGRRKEGWGDVTVIGSQGDAEVVRFVRRLKEEDAAASPGKEKKKDIWLMGGGRLAGLLMREGLVDVVEAAIMPVVIERGVGMFADGGEGTEEGERVWKLKLESVRAMESGIVMTRYRVVHEQGWTSGAHDGL
ncbi:dihydrofolate reductase-like domain-containing protein [Chaetomium strumarium]|uniref:2,5-diamino-6-ribosylamino-4(3H)-pyrimidinone 5'-phosphate reductase n=1 Tax=Chaetomium strumarium TaxID=1170767 RepID=A0AAJ0H089_9PEZI|nr:dihydrofolate reductase-like domain-containing protein [Chaetomium strumarium]